MAATPSSSPQFPAEGDTIELSATGTLGDVFVWEVISVPPNSAVPLGFLTSRTLTAAEQAGTIASTAQKIADNDIIGSSFVGDLAGEYGISIWEFRETLGYTAGHDTDAQADARFDLKSVTSLTLSVGANVDLPVVTRLGDGATLRLLVHEDTVREASLVEARTERGRAAALETATVAALAAIIGTTVTAMGNELLTATNDLYTNFASHRALLANPGVVHQNADTVNVPSAPLAKSQADAIVLLNELRDKLFGHLRDGPLTGVSPGWHLTGEEDTRNVPLAADAIDVASATVLAADLRVRVYERHRRQFTSGTPPFDDPASHEDDEDDVNVLTASTALDDVIAAYFDAMADTNPTAAVGEPEGVQEAGNRYGFVRVET